MANRLMYAIHDIEHKGDRDVHHVNWVGMNRYRANAVFRSRGKMIRSMHEMGMQLAHPRSIILSAHKVDPTLQRYDDESKLIQHTDTHGTKVGQYNYHPSNSSMDWGITHELSQGITKPNIDIPADAMHSVTLLHGGK